MGARPGSGAGMPGSADLAPDYDGGGRKTLLKRLRMVVRADMIEHVFYPVFPPDRHAEGVLAWLRTCS